MKHIVFRGVRRKERFEAWFLAQPQGTEILCIAPLCERNADPYWFIEYLPPELAPDERLQTALWSQTTPEHI